jgi:hypothetical protein
MLRSYPDDRGDDSPAAERDDEVAPIRRWQLERLKLLGYRTATAAMIVADAWLSGEHTDLVHRIEDLIAAGATLDQAARIVVPVSDNCPRAA